ncbi:hypothetical protein G6N05_09350 [Flavobacterium sp. F372]|uniref:YhhN-like protein n=1 Tax=Flavobacterium bernardetii TaxID=2813823 RepID=A0ABR7IY76_9FLAO|nr:hypothetical protein [Flavobacterium bernardetii]MBC5834663.1 hypothetical protein [Flavobacterium bernardetii]NHF70311.1 hypothetical protein [Flavobacterium bernardetii]
MIKIFQNNKNTINILILVYFLNLVLYSICSFLKFTSAETIFWFSRIPILLILYLFTGKNNFIYITSLLLYQLASYLFASGNPDLFMYGSISSLGYKLLLLIILVPLITKENRLAISLACLPFFVLFLYIIELVLHSLGDSFYIWILNALITSIIGGIAIIHFNNNFDLKGYWLLISSILFIIQIGAFFINKFYIKSESIYQMVIFFYGLSHFTFYKFMILKEQEKLNIST